MTWNTSRLPEWLIKNLHPLITHTMKWQKQKRVYAVPMETYHHTTHSTMVQTVIWGGEKGAMDINNWKVKEKKKKVMRGTWEQKEQIKAKHVIQTCEENVLKRNKLHLLLPLNTSIQLDQHHLALALHDIKHNKWCLRNLEGLFMYVEVYYKKKKKKKFVCQYFHINPSYTVPHSS